MWPIRRQHKLNVLLYTRKGCHLCDEAYHLLRQHRIRPQVKDVDEDPQLVEDYGECVPVVLIDGKVRFRGRVSTVLLRRLLKK